MKIDIGKSSVVVSEGGMVAEAKLPLRFAHLGCKRLVSAKTERVKARNDARRAGKPEPPLLSEAMMARLEAAIPGWSTPEVGAAKSVGLALKSAIALSGAEGVELWDTMRRGSDTYRPGGLLSEAIETIDGRALFCHLDALCPPAALLEEFRDKKPPLLPFAEFAQRYGDWLSEGGRLDLALGVVALAQARGSLPVFYCTDPYVPGYADPAEMTSEIPMRDRKWPLADELRAEGCHRVVLADRLIRHCRARGASIELFELDPTRCDAWRSM